VQKVLLFVLQVLQLEEQYTQKLPLTANPLQLFTQEDPNRNNAPKQDVQLFALVHDAQGELQVKH
jgi:hypothetical protein